MTVSRETLMAFVDGELSPEEERRVAAEVAKDPALVLYVERQKQLAVQLKTAFAPVLEQPVPAHIEQMVLSAKIASQPSLAKKIRRFWREHTSAASRGFIPAGALVAGLLLGLALNGLLSTGSDMRTQGGALIAQGELARVMTAELASEQTAQTAIARIGVSFVNRDGSFCRSFETAPGANGASAGIACRTGDEWRIVVLTQSERKDSGEFATASGEMPAIVRNALNALIAGDPLDAAQERAARDGGWTQR